MTRTNNQVILLVLDGWGISTSGPGNAIAQAATPNFDRLLATFPNTELTASGSAVGLPEGTDGNSEVGHLNLGAGRIVPQDVLRINQAITDGSFYKNPVFLQSITHAQKNQSQIHLLGLIGEGLVHASNQHLYAMLNLLSRKNFKRVYLHLITDGRDSPPRSALLYLKEAEKEMKHYQLGEIASIMGRYWAMDRDLRWDRTQAAYNCLTCGQGEKAQSAQEAIKQAYRRGESDEFIKPTLIFKNHTPLAAVQNQDTIIFYNFRIDRPRQLTKAFVLTDFEARANQTGPDPYKNEFAAESSKDTDPQPPFKRQKVLDGIFFVTMTEYEKNLPTQIAFHEKSIELPLGQVISQAGFTQLRAAETEKERFVSYYFNGFREEPFPKEERLIVPSPKVATYDLQPEMSIYLLTDQFIKQLEQGNFQFALLNFANPDMVAHTGKLAPAIKACEAVDECLGGLSEFALSQGASLLVCADHGNAEELININTGEIDTKHSTSPVPFILINERWKDKPSNLPSGILGDVAPSILKLLDLPQPEIMTGKSLINNIL